MLRIARLIGITLWIVVLLLAFPSAIPWMLLSGVLLHSACLINRRPSLIPLSILISILLVKNVDWPLSMPIFLLVAVVNIGWLNYMNRKSDCADQVSLANRRGLLIGSLALWGSCGWVAVDWHRSANSSLSVSQLSGKTIVCLGDSLTACGYPKVLAGLTDIPIVDFGHNGITSEEAKMILMSSQFLEQNPQILILEIGGHDWNQGYRRKVAETNIESMIQHCQSNHIAVILVEIPRGFITDFYGGFERRLARKYDLQLVSDTMIRQLVYFSAVIPPGSWLDSNRHLSEDGLHPNSNGNQMMAHRICRAVNRLTGQ